LLDFFFCLNDNDVDGGARKHELNDNKNNDKEEQGEDEEVVETMDTEKENKKIKNKKTGRLQTPGSQILFDVLCVLCALCGSRR
jgi:hypothetical protein